MTQLPTGTVTFFFSDIEGSTRLVESLGHRYDALLDRHREIVRDAFRRHGAVEVSTQGDSFFAAVPDAVDAVAASVGIQRAMGTETWAALSGNARTNGSEASVRIRIGLHTGEGRIAADDYVGLDVHRAARIMSAAHGGQIVASKSTFSQARPQLDPEVALRDLGEHRLKDLSAPEHLYQVVADGLGVEFPPLRTLDRTPNNLPTQPSPLIGRTRELDQIRGLLEAGRRLITLTGPGGIGKTRLALQAAADQIDRIDHGVYFVDLSPATDADGALQELARVLHASAPSAVELRTALAEHIAERHLLLVLDNVEHVIAAADDVADLLRLCPRLIVLATSREALRVRGEQLVPIEPLALPEPAPGRSPTSAAELAKIESVRLFVERAAEARPEFELTDGNAPVVADICIRLDGLPLAIELAAARLRLFSVTDLRDRLGRRLDVLRGGARDLPHRQRTLRDTIEWSHELLDEDERALFALLSVFAGARIDAVERVADRLPWLARVDVVGRLESLVDKSLVRSIPDRAGQRLSMLGTIRDFAAEHLAADLERATGARAAHAAEFQAYAIAQSERLTGEDRAAALDELAVELGNLLAAWRFYVETRDMPGLKGLLDVLWNLHEARGWYHGALAMTTDLLEVLAVAPTMPDPLDAEVTLRLSAARLLLALRGYTEEVERQFEEALELAKRAGVPRRLPVLRALASFHLYRGEIEKTLRIGQEMLQLAEDERDDRMLLEAHVVLGPALAFSGQIDEGIASLERAIELFDPVRHGATRFRLGPSPGVVAPAVSALLSFVRGDTESADRRAAGALEVAARLGHPYSTAYATFHVGLLDLWSGRVDVASRRAREVVAIAEAQDYEIWRAIGFVLDGVTTAALGDPEAGLARAEQGVGLYREISTPPVFWPQILSLRATARALAGRPREALEALGEASAIALEGSWDSAVIKVERGTLLLELDDPDAAAALFEAALDEAVVSGARMVELRAARALARLPGPRGDRGRERVQEMAGTQPS